MSAIKKSEQLKGRRLFSYVEVSCIIHATEELEKVLVAVKNVFPAEDAEEINFEQKILSGFYKNPITMLKAVITEKRKVVVFMRRFLEMLEPDDRALLSSEFRSYVDSAGNLYLRVNKQEAFRGKMRLNSVDSIRIKIKLNMLPTTLEELESILAVEK